jgi:hypothetical protein
MIAGRLDSWIWPLIRRKTDSELVRDNLASKIAHCEFTVQLLA